MTYNVSSGTLNFAHSLTYSFSHCTAFTLWSDLMCTAHNADLVLASQHYNLRRRTHTFSLPEHITSLSWWQHHNHCRGCYCYYYYYFCVRVYVGSILLYFGVFYVGSIDFVVNFCCLYQTLRTHSLTESLEECLSYFGADVGCGLSASWRVMRPMRKLLHRTFCSASSATWRSSASTPPASESTVWRSTPITQRPGQQRSNTLTSTSSSAGNCRRYVSYSYSK